MAGDTDLDLALAIALAEASDGYSDDDFRPSSKQVELRQQNLIAKCRNIPVTKSKSAPKNKRQKTQVRPAASSARQSKDTGASRSRDVSGHKKHSNSRKGLINPANRLRHPSVSIEGSHACAESDKTGKHDKLFDSFRYQSPQCQDIPRPATGSEEGRLVAKLHQVVESANYQNDSSGKTEDEDLIFITNIASPETSQPVRHEVHDPDRDVVLVTKDREEVIADSHISSADDPVTQEIIGLEEESQFSALLRLCSEETENKEYRTEDPAASVVQSGIESQGSGRRRSQVGKLAGSRFDTIVEAHTCDLDDSIDDISYLMTQQHVPRAEQIESCAEECIPAFQDITNRSRGTDDRIVSGTDCLNVNIICPICDYDLSEITLELRVKHTEMCLTKIHEPQECLSDKTTEEHHPISRDFSISFGCEKVKEWLGSLNLSRYVDSFNQSEIDWDTLQWLTDEDLQLIGVTCLGPRRKILGALQALKSLGAGKSTEPPVLSASRLEYDSLRNVQTTGKAAIKLITNFFPITTETGEKCVSNVVKQHVVVSKQGRASGVPSNRPRISHRPNVRGVPAWMCIPGTPFRVDAFQHLSGDCSHWFLTHFHTDHYQGLTRGFRYGRIFCSAITARLVNRRIGVSWDRLMIVPLNEKFKICGVDVTFIDANHCPGSVMILFEPPNGEAVLHTGDFRFCSAIADSAVLQSTAVHTLILDTTYCDPQYDFPKQESVIQFVIDAIQAEAFNRETLFLIGTYTIGKERIFLEVGKVLQKKVYVGSAKMKLLECMDLSAEDTKWLTCDDQESYIHVVPLWSISSFKRMNSISRHYHGRYKLIVAFSPTGWSLGRGKKKTPGKRHQQGTMIRYEVPYSEHSSFRELQEFVRFIGPEDIIPSVPGKSGAGPDAMIASLWSEDQ